MPRAVPGAVAARAKARAVELMMRRDDMGDLLAVVLMRARSYVRLPRAESGESTCFARSG
jgi:hypothetical protein